MDKLLSEGETALSSMNKSNISNISSNIGGGDECIDGFYGTINKLSSGISGIKDKTASHVSTAIKFFKFLLAIMVFACILPSIPIILVMILALAIIKYILLKFRLL